MLGTVALAVVGEGLTWFRRNRMSGAAALARPGRLGELVRWLRRGPTRWRAAMASLFAVQATLGYFLMLIAMTYQGELFIAVIFGLSLGHAAFNVSAPVSESADACCVDDAADADAAAAGGGGGGGGDGVTLATKIHPAAVLNGGGASDANGGGATTDTASAAHAAKAVTTNASANGSASPYERLSSPASVRIDLDSAAATASEPAAAAAATATAATAAAAAAAADTLAAPSLAAAAPSLTAPCRLVRGDHLLRNLPRTSRQGPVVLRPVARRRAQLLDHLGGRLRHRESIWCRAQPVPSLLCGLRAVSAAALQPIFPTFLPTRRG